MGRRRGLPGTGCLAIRSFETDARGLLDGLLLLFNLSVQISYDRLSFNCGVLTNAFEIPSFWSTAKCAFIFPCFPAFLVRKLLSS